MALPITYPQEEHPFFVFVALPMIVYLGLYWSLSAFFALTDLYLARRGLLQKHKRQPQPFRQGMDWKKYKESARRALLNQLLISIPLALLFYPLWSWRGITFTGPLPGPLTLLCQVAGILFVLDTMFYFGHRLLHTPKLYRLIHRTHHRWRAPVACSGHDAHPIEHLLANMLPFLLGPLLVGLHWKLVLLWFGIATYRVIAAHSGYKWRFLGSVAHDAHHQFLVVNFGIIGFWDRILGTSEKPRRGARSL